MDSKKPISFSFTQGRVTLTNIDNFVENINFENMSKKYNKTDNKLLIKHIISLIKEN